MVASYLLGRKAKCYFNNAKTKFAAVVPATVSQWLTEPTTVEADNITDVTLNMSADFADTTTRGEAADGFASSVPVLKNGEVTFEMRWKPEDPAMIAAPFSFTRVLMDAWETDDTVSLAFLDQVAKSTQIPLGTDVKVQGLAGNFAVSIDKTEALRDIQRANVTLTIVDSGKWHQETISGS